MPQAVAAAWAAIKAWVVANKVLAAFYAATALLAIDASIRARKLGKFRSDNDLRRQALARSAVGPRNIVLGKTLVGGTLAYMNVAGTYNKELWIVVAHAGHEVNDITDMWLYDQLVGEANIYWGSNVTGGDYYISGSAYAAFYRNLGTSTQTALTALTNAFSDFTSDHRGRGVAYTATKLILDTASEKVFESGAPQSVRALIEGAPNVYDPRLDSSPGTDPTNASYQAYTTNPILLAAWYLTDSAVGAGVSTSKIDWQVVADEASYCDVMVPNSTDGFSEKRFTCNGFLTTAGGHDDNVDDILTACNGRRSYRNGKINLRAGRFGTGANLLTNPTFTSDVTSWTLGVNGAVQGVTTVVGYVYTCRVTVKEAISASNTYQLAKSDNSNGSSPTDTSATITSGHDKSLYLTFTATATTSYICLNSTAAAASSLNWTAGKLQVVDASANDAMFDDAECYLVASAEVDETWLAGDIGLQTATPKSDRFNTARGYYTSAAEGYKKVEALTVTNTAFVARDDDQTLIESYDLPMTDTEDEAQRILHKRIQQTDQQKILRLPCNYKALNVAVHDQVMVSISEFSWTKKIFRVTDWEMKDGDEGITMVLREDGHAGYEDPDQNDYSTRSASGGVTVATPEVPPPTNVTLTSKEGINELTWTNPTLADYFDVVEVWAHTSASFGSATKLATVRGDSYQHKLDNGENRYYWVRAAAGAETSTEVASSPTNASAANALAAAATTAEWPNIVDDDSYVPTRRLVDIEQTIFDQFITWARLNQGVIAGYPGATTLIADLMGGADRGTLLIDIVNGYLDGLKYSTGNTVDDLEPGEAGADVTGNNTANDTTYVNGVASTVVTTAVSNFNAGNDRDGTAVTAPTIASDGTAVDHITNTDGSVDVSFEWSWGGTESDIDGFILHLYNASSSSSYTFGTTPAGELQILLPADRRAYGFLGVAANRYYTFGVQAYRIVDADINASGIIKSTLVQCALAAEDPYQPATWPSFAGDLIGTIDGSAIGTLATKNAVDLATGEVGNRTGAHITYTSGGGTLDSLKPAAVDADVTGDNTANNTTNVSDRTAADIAEEAFALSFGAFLRSLLGSIGGYPGAETIITSLWGGTDRGTLLIDALDGTIDGLKYSGGAVVDDLEPAQPGATANTGDLLADTFELTGDVSATTGTGTDINTWSQSYDGSCPITLNSNTEFEFDETGLYLVAGQITWKWDMSSSSTTVEAGATLLIQRDTTGSFANYRTIDRFHSTPNTNIAGKDESIPISFLFPVTIANTKIKFKAIEANHAGVIEADNTFLDIIKLEQVAD